MCDHIISVCNTMFPHYTVTHDSSKDSEKPNALFLRKTNDLEEYVE